MRSRGVSARQTRLHYLANVVTVEPGDRHIIRNFESQTLAFERRADRRSSLVQKFRPVASIRDAPAA
jgi:hypothetical protein